jgi:nucleoside-diphosphate-sugar epimerase
MKVLITGGSGRVGKAVVERLVRGGHDVLVVGRKADVETPGARYASCDVTHYDDVRRHMAGRDAVVHLAAVPSPTQQSGPEVMRVNVQGTFHVYEAAAREGVRRVVQASSINAFGLTYAVRDLDHLRYFPIDEEHPTGTTDPYAFSKELVERIGEYYWRRDGVSGTALRLPWVHPAGHQYGRDHRDRMARERALLDELRAMPEAARVARLAEARRQAVEHRLKRPLEFDAPRRGVERPKFDDLLTAMCWNDRHNFFTFIDERDSAQAIEKSLTANYDGAHTLFVNDSHNQLLYDSETLVRFLYPEVPGRRQGLSGSGTLVSIEAARKLIGFEPEFSVAGAGQ